MSDCCSSETSEEADETVANRVVVAQEEPGCEECYLSLEDPTILGGVSKDNPIGNEQIVANGVVVEEEPGFEKC